MSGYKYEALAPDGRVRRGVLESDSPRQARARLREQGLLPVEIEAIAHADPAGSNSTATVRRVRRRRLGATALALLTRQLATLLGAGLTIEQALNALIDQSERDAERQLLAAVRGDVLAGQALARALGRHPAAFPEVYVTLVDAGERSGRLADVLARLADYTEEREQLRAKVALAFIYPALVTIVAVTVVTGLLLYVVPQVVQVFQNANQQLPFLTRALIGLSSSLSGPDGRRLACRGCAHAGTRSCCGSRSSARSPGGSTPHVSPRRSRSWSAAACRCSRACAPASASCPTSR
jgi:general secretion pathway protein F